MALRLEGITVDGIFDLFRRKITEVHRLAGIRTNAGSHKHQPRQKFAACLIAFLRQKLAGLLSEVEENRVRVENSDLAIDNRWQFRIWIDSQVFRLVLLPLASIDRYCLIGQFGFLQKEGNLGRV